MENFEVYISFASNRFEVKFSFRLENEMLDDNFLLRKRRLKNPFNGKFTKDPGLFKRYEEIIRDQAELLKTHQSHTL